MSKPQNVRRTQDTQKSKVRFYLNVSRRTALSRRGASYGKTNQSCGSYKRILLLSPES